MAAQQKKDNDWFAWVLIVFLFAVGLAPLALLLLFFKLFGGDGKKKQASPPPLQTRSQTAEQAAPRQPSKAREAVEKVTKTPQAKKSTAFWLKLAGAVLAAVGIIACVEPIDMMVWLGSVESYYIEDLLTALAMVLGGGAMVGSGLSMDRQLKRHAKYLSVMGDREAVAVEELSRVLGYPKKRVEKDLQKMIDKGYFGGRAYLNMELGYFFRSSEADARVARERTEARDRRKAESAQAAENEYDRILRDIRRANDEIADPVLSAKIQRLEDVTAGIFQAVQTDPAKRSRIDTFLNYYLPTTQKLLDSYARFESAGVEGENLRQAKIRIEKTMDSIVAGFEHQLDQLYKEDAMDVDSDIRVMETMLHRDTATVEQDFGLGGSAVQREEE